MWPFSGSENRGSLVRGCSSLVEEATELSTKDAVDRNDNQILFIFIKKEESNDDSGKRLA